MKRKLRNYFKQVKVGKITEKEAADQIGCSYYRFKTEYEKFYDPFRKKFRGNYSIVIATGSFILSCLSLLIAVHSGIIEQKSYKMESSPDLSVQENLVTIYWDDNGKLKNTDDAMIDDEFYRVTDTISVEGVLIHNLGKSAAKNIEYDWKYKENMDMFDVFCEDAGIYIDSHYEGDKLIVDGLRDNESFQYTMASEKVGSLAIDKYNYVTIPVVYYELLARYCYETFPSEDEVNYADFFEDGSLPEIELGIKYTNTMGEEKEDTLIINFEPIRYKILNGKVSGCTFQIRGEVQFD